MLRQPPTYLLCNFMLTPSVYAVKQIIASLNPTWTIQNLSSSFPVFKNPPGASALEDEAHQHPTGFVTSTAVTAARREAAEEAAYHSGLKT